jgi:hypothetical protein
MSLFQEVKLTLVFSAVAGLCAYGVWRLLGFGHLVLGAFRVSPKQLSTQTSIAVNALSIPPRCITQSQIHSAASLFRSSLLKCSRTLLGMTCMSRELCRGEG